MYNYTHSHIRPLNSRVNPACAFAHAPVALIYANANDADVLLRLLLVDLCILNLVHHVHALRRAAEDGMFPVEPRLRKVQTRQRMPKFQKYHGIAIGVKFERKKRLTVLSVVMKN